MGFLRRGLEPLNRRLSSRARREWLSRPGIPLEQKNVPSAAQLEKNGLPQKPSEKSVFLNIPYDPQFSDLCLAYIAGIACFGLTALGDSPLAAQRAAAQSQNLLM